MAQLVAQSSNPVVATARKASALAPIPSSNIVLKLELDMTSESSIDPAFRATLEKLGRIDVIVNNADALAGESERAEDGESPAVLNANFRGMIEVVVGALGTFRDANPKTGQQVV